MLLRVIQIGNSKGIRLSKTILEKYRITDAVEIQLEKDQIILKPVQNPRQGWDNDFAVLHSSKEDELLIPDVFEDENLDEWK
ncbi:MAG: AbrB/MazE/SpoVT family DNA-binding domain-containing protein [Bacteroidota bacterium]|nr:AbrB/MazE/SpoVT family DNA-binding domain-containing protein [Bacteroidota bacterium]